MAKYVKTVRKPGTRRAKRLAKKGIFYAIKGKPKKKPTPKSTQPRFQPSPASFGDLLDTK